MHLVSPLAAGFRGAENGTADIYLHGTTTRATLYEGADGDGAYTPSAAVDLDGNGRLTVYVAESVDCAIRDTDGDEVSSFTVFGEAAATNYRGAAFTGTNPFSAATGQGTDYPEDINTVLTRWQQSAAGASATAAQRALAIDWNVVLDGSAVSLASALGPLAGSWIYNVKAYGAAGDATTDDTAAIQAAADACDAADGGILLFPPGYYRVTTAIDVASTTTVMGAGVNSAFVAIDSPTAGCFSVATGSASYPLTFSAVTVLSAQSNTGNLIEATGTGQLDVIECRIGSTLAATCAYTTTAGMRFFRCYFELKSGATTSFIQGKTVALHHCQFATPDSYAATNGYVYAENILATDCAFQSGATLGTVSVFKWTSTTVLGRITRCRFVQSNGTVTAFELGTYAAASRFFESDNDFAGAGVTAYSFVNAGTTPGAMIQLGSRSARILELVSNADPLDISSYLGQYGTLFVKRSTNADQVIDIASAGMLPDSNFFTLVVANHSGAAITATSVLGGGVIPYRASAALANGTAFTKMFTATTRTSGGGAAYQLVNGDGYTVI
jgi:hypothetical protein